MHLAAIHRRFLVCLLLAIFTATSRADDAVAPFRLALVPAHSSNKGGSIAAANDQPEQFYVVLTNVSDSAQPVFESWNSWGYQNISFEFTASDGRKFQISKLGQDFTRNFPSTFLISPGEHRVYPIRLDKEWTPFAGLSGVGEITVTCRVSYHVGTSKESREQKVWDGRVESKDYELTLRYW